MTQRPGTQLPGCDQLATISLPELEQSAALLTRMDRKYVVDQHLLTELMAEHAGQFAVLTIDDRCNFEYESVYFDTPDLALHRAAAAGRRRRFKVRTRLYDTDTAMLEVKAKDGRGRTVKHRLEYSPADQGTLTVDGLRFIDDWAGQSEIAGQLIPSLTTRYMRSTLVDTAAGTRATVDRHLVCVAPCGSRIAFGPVIVETKSDLAASPLDRWLWQRGERPVRISKYCTGLAAIYPELPANRWHRTLARHFEP